MLQEKLKHSYLDISDNFDIAWNVFLKNWQVLIWFLLVISFPLSVIAQFVPQPTPDVGNDLTQSQATFYFFGFGFSIINSILGILLNLAISIATEKTILDEEVTALSALKQGFSKIAIVIVIGFLLSILIGIGLILLVIPGIYLSVLFAFFTEAIALRNCVFDALNYSSNLVQGQWWKVFGRLLLLGISFALLIVALSIPQLILTSLFAQFPIIQGGITIILNLGPALISYLFIIAFTVYFLNLDYLKNGLPLRA